MDKKPVDEIEARIKEVLEAQPPYPVEELKGLVAGLPSGKAEAAAGQVFKALTAAADFNGAIAFLNACGTLVKMTGEAVRDELRLATKDRLLLSFVDAVLFDKRSLKECLGRLGRLMSFEKGVYVLSQAWGIGKIVSVDYFYRRVTVDFRTRRGHQFTYDAACETLVLAPKDHILRIRAEDEEKNPACSRVETLIKDQPAEFVKAVLKSFGDMPVTRLEEVCVQNGFIKQAGWKKFWESARADLHEDKCIEIPTRRAEPIHLKAKPEDYGESWLTTFCSLKEPKCILSSVRELQETDHYKTLTDEGRAALKPRLAERLAYALKAAKGVDDALYARIAFCIEELQLDPYLQEEKLAHAQTKKARAYLWTRTPVGNELRFLKAAELLPARDMANLVKFITDGFDAATAPEGTVPPKTQLFAVLEKMTFPLLSATLTFFSKDAECEEVVSGLLQNPKAPATLVTFILGRYDEFKAWTKLPPLVVILMHAIALGEGKQERETLRMQNIIRRLFADAKWLEKTFALLQPADQVLFFERFQASIAWDPSTHHLIVVRMTKIVPSLADRLVKKETVKKIERITSLRSYAERQAAYEKLIKVEIPENTRKIEFAKSYGDLSENAEYQYAKDEQRALLKKQTDLQDDLNEVKAVDFADVTAPTSVCSGSTVTILTAAGDKRVYTLLGEWDNDLTRGIISNKTRLAQNLFGKVAGETFDLPDADGNLTTATILSVDPLSDEIRAWIAAPVTAA